MSNSEKYQSWWERASMASVLLNILFFPVIVLKQSQVASDGRQAPLGTTHEEYPTIPPIKTIGL